MTRSASQPRTHRAREILSAVSHAYPTAWQRVDGVRAACGNGLLQWPDWCFLPLRYAHAIATGGSGQLLPYERSHHTGMLGALAALARVAGNLSGRFTLYDALINTALNRDLPHEPGRGIAIHDAQEHFAPITKFSDNGPLLASDMDGCRLTGAEFRAVRRVRLSIDWSTATVVIDSDPVAGVAGTHNRHPLKPGRSPLDVPAPSGWQWLNR